MSQSSDRVAVRAASAELEAGSELSAVDLKEAALAGARSITLARVAAESLAFAASVSLARLVAPAEFGRAAIAIAFTGLALAIADQGVGSSLVRRKALRRSDLEGAMVLSLGSGAALTALIFLLAPSFSDPLFGQRTTELIRLVSPVFVISSLSAVPKAVLQRRLAFRRLSIVEVASLLTGAVTSVSLALAGLNAEALVLGALLTSGASALLLLASVPFVPPRWRWQEMRDAASFGVPTALASLTSVAYRNVDYAIVGAKLGAAQVGFYWRAFQLGAENQGKISRIMLRVAFPIFSRTSSLEDMRAVRRRIVRLHAAVIFPLLFLYVALAPELVPWLFGARWEPAIVPSQILAVSGLTYALGTGSGALVLATGHPRALLVNNVVTLAVYGIVVFLTADHGLTAVCVGVTIVNLVGLVATYYFLVDRLVGIPLSHLVSDVVPATVAGGALLGVAFALAGLLSHAGAPTLVLLGATSALAALVYLSVLRLAFRSEWADLILLARRIVGRGEDSSPAGAAASGR